MREYNFQNLTVSWSQPNPKSGICVCSGSALGLLRQTESWPQANPQMDPKLTPSRSQADPEQTQKADPKRKHGVWSNHDNKKKKQITINQSEQWPIRSLVDNSIMQGKWLFTFNTEQCTNLNLSIYINICLLP